MVRVAARSLLCLSLFMLLAGCSVEVQTQRIGRLYEAVRAQPQIQTPDDYEVPTPEARVVDPIAKADVLVFAARPGDAVVSAYATILKAKQEDMRVVIVYVTNGDAQTDVARSLAGLPASATPTPDQYLQSAAVLQELALQVAGSALGMEPEDVIFLAYPDGALHELTAEAPDKAVRSPFTGKDGLFDAGITPYRIVRSGESAPYSFNAVLHDLSDILVELNPREIYLPSPANTDATAAAAGRLIAQSLREVAPREAGVFTYIQAAEGQPPPDRRVPVTDPAAKQRALDVYGARIGLEGWPAVPDAMLAEEQFWAFDPSAEN